MATTFQDVISFLATNDLSSEEHSRLASVVNARLAQRKRSAMRNFCVGDRVTFTNKWGSIERGVIKKVGRGTFHVMSDAGMPWRVSATLLKSE